MGVAKLREIIAAALDPELRSAPGLSPLNQLVIALILFSILVGILETEVTLTAGYGASFATAQLVFFVTFAAEYAARLWIAGLNPRYGSWFRYARSPAAIIDLLVLLSFSLPAFGMEGALLRVFRAARIVRLARLGRYSTAISMVLNAVAARRYELGVSLAIGMALMALSSTALYLAESAAQPETFGSIPRAMWWSVATLTTVGYGDAVPVTSLGKVFAAVTALVGIAIIAVPTGILAGAFGEALREAHKTK